VNRALGNPKLPRVAVPQAGEVKSVSRRRYCDHEPVYRRRREQGFRGWDSPDGANPFGAFQDFLESGAAPAVSRALDLGCGGGEIAICLSRRGWAVTAIDYSRTAVELARANAEEAGVPINLLVADLTEPWPLESGIFSLAIDNHVLHCLIGPGDRLAFLHNAFGALRTDGIMFSANMSAEGNLDYARHGIDPVTRIDSHRTRYWATRDELVEEFSQAGFRIASVRVLEQDSTDDNAGAEIVIYAAK
jgi:2-polyprenyl-3-methyl-5-hydroxy-6-metoxy-1,4-benzoquinol methylase